MTLLEPQVVVVVQVGQVVLPQAHLKPVMAVLVLLGHIQVEHTQVAVAVAVNLLVARAVLVAVVRVE
jgi:hypothetical protein